MGSGATSLTFMARNRRTLSLAVIPSMHSNQIAVFVHCCGRTTVLPFAKFGKNHFIKMWLRAKRQFRRIGVTTRAPLVKRTPTRFPFMLF